MPSLVPVNTQNPQPPPATMPLPGAPGVSADPTKPRPPIWLLVAMIAIGPFTMQVLVPSLPSMGRDFGASTAAVQLTVTLYLLSVGVGQLIYGPLSDRFGRRPLLMGGLALYAVASLGAAMAGGIGWLVIARAFQAMGACAGVVLARAVIRDVWARDQAASVLGYVTMGMTIAPMLAPLLGSYLDQTLGWRASMWACLVFGLPLALVAWKRLPETLPAPQPLPGLFAILAAYRSLWAIPVFRAYAALTACATGVFFAFLGGAPYVVVQGMGYTPVQFAIGFAAISVFFAAGNWLAGVLSKRLGILRMLSVGTMITVVGSIGAVVGQLAFPPHILVFFVPMVLVGVGNGMTQPNAIAGALSAKPQLAGTASSLVGALQMGFGALMTFVVGLVEYGAGIGTALTMAATGSACWLALRGARRG
ncbi:MFS transporter, DHA1 family, bicyclomycin/chloramphenicol resistance protein [Falsiroseomonas stagni DSM 19981]|uniref:Bcr/CflA family efflux transporter n=2 Tax=Falsiroseomonas TaxID=2870713 RepID=A0A1I3Y3H0_9PROT|nr:MFS transporter, DHA1 family, bicyclomycin/chloramphenicol resistance protein [Falsiroseomonas stagni DSM 19981]